MRTKRKRVQDDTEQESNDMPNNLQDFEFSPQQATNSSIDNSFHFEFLETPSFSIFNESAVFLPKPSMPSDCQTAEDWAKELKLNQINSCYHFSEQDAKLLFSLRNDEDMMVQDMAIDLCSMRALKPKIWSIIEKERKEGSFSMGTCKFLAKRDYNCTYWIEECSIMLKNNVHMQQLRFDIIMLLLGTQAQITNYCPNIHLEVEYYAKHPQFKDAFHSKIEHLFNTANYNCFVNNQVSLCCYDIALNWCVQKLSCKFENCKQVVLHLVLNNVPSCQTLEQVIGIILEKPIDLTATNMTYLGHLSTYCEQNCSTSIAKLALKLYFDQLAGIEDISFLIRNVDRYFNASGLQRLLPRNQMIVEWVNNFLSVNPSRQHCIVALLLFQFVERCDHSRLAFVKLFRKFMENKHFILNEVSFFWFRLFAQWHEVLGNIVRNELLVFSYQLITHSNVKEVWYVYSF